MLHLQLHSLLPEPEIKGAQPENAPSIWARNIDLHFPDRVQFMTCGNPGFCALLEIFSPLASESIMCYLIRVTKGGNYEKGIHWSIIFCQLQGTLLILIKEWSGMLIQVLEQVHTQPCKHTYAHAHKYTHSHKNAHSHTLTQTCTVEGIGISCCLQYWLINGTSHWILVSMFSCKLALNR